MESNRNQNGTGSRRKVLVPALPYALLCNKKRKLGMENGREEAGQANAKVGR